MINFWEKFVWVLEKILWVLKKIWWIVKKIPWVEIIITIVVAALVGFIVVPTFDIVVDNGERKICQANMRRITSELSVRLESEESAFWNDLINTGTSSAVMTALKQKIGDDELDISDYKIERGENSLTVYCLKHEKLEQSMDAPEYKINESSEEVNLIESLSVSGVGEYRVGYALDKSNPEKMFFKNGDNLKQLFPDLSVTLTYNGGMKRKLNADEYSIITGSFDMSVTGEKTLIIGYRSTGDWNDELNAVYSFNVTKTGGQLIVEGGDAGSYELASWKWQNYVDDVKDERMDFDASIVEYGDEFYYYPDGFTIMSRNKNENPLKSAFDIENNRKPAYCIRFDTSSVIKDQQSETPHEGSLKIEDEQIYIWQTQPSREESEGWLRVYAEIKRL